MSREATPSITVILFLSFLSAYSYNWRLSTSFPDRIKSTIGSIVGSNLLTTGFSASCGNSFVTGSNLSFTSMAFKLTSALISNSIKTYPKFS